MLFNGLMPGIINIYLKGAPSERLFLYRKTVQPKPDGRLSR